jgi:hypothetical protein
MPMGSVVIIDLLYAILYSIGMMSFVAIICIATLAILQSSDRW